MSIESFPVHIMTDATVNPCGKLRAITKIEDPAVTLAADGEYNLRA